MVAFFCFESASCDYAIVVFEEKCSKYFRSQFHNSGSATFLNGQADFPCPKRNEPASFLMQFIGCSLVIGNESRFYQNINPEFHRAILAKFASCNSN